MRLWNVRLGHATNSSSSHSIVILTNGHSLSPNTEDDRQDYGWENFTLTGETDKKAYLAQTLRYALERQLPEDVAHAACREWLGGMDYQDEGHVDHQSIIDLPVRYDRPVVHGEFVQEFLRFLARPDVAILGGNDNSDDHPDLNHPNVKEIGFGLPRESYTDHLVARKDDQGFWILFNRETGARFILDFDDPLRQKTEPERSSVPLLVDLKITDHCPLDCAFCYQGSTKAGQHAENLAEIPRVLRDLQVFECAIGGGEPTIHPGFAQLVVDLRKNGVVPNFTTRNLTWLRDATVWPRVIESIGGFAFSTEKANDVERVVKALKKNKIQVNAYDSDGQSKLSIQVVMGVVPEDEFKRIIAACAKHKVKLTLLGYKYTGRGLVHGTPHDFDWLAILKDLRAQKDYWQHLPPAISIDTALAHQYQAKLTEEGIPRLLYQTEEGRFSMYWDAVTQRVGPSSYCAPKDMVGLVHRYDTTNEIKGAFQRFALPVTHLSDGWNAEPYDL